MSEASYAHEDRTVTWRMPLPTPRDGWAGVWDALRSACTGNPRLAVMGDWVAEVNLEIPGDATAYVKFVKVRRA